MKSPVRSTPSRSWASSSSSIGYVLANLTYMSQTTVAVAVPSRLPLCAASICERSGVVNIGLEGIMLTAAFIGWIVGSLAAAAIGPGDAAPATSA